MPAPTALDEFYFVDPRVVLVPIEHLGPDGVSAAFADLLCARAGWPAEQIDLLSAGFARYWSRTAELARRTADWAPPRLRHIAVVGAPYDVHPLAQMLNTSAWTLYAGDLDPSRSHPELVAYLLAHGDRLAITGEVTAAAVLNAAWWFERDDAERAAFAAAADASERPNADELRGIARGLDWLRQLGHVELRPDAGPQPHPIAGTGLRVPQSIRELPAALVNVATAAARASVAAYDARWRNTDLAAVAAVVEWLAATTPSLLIVARDRVLWDPIAAARTTALRAELKRMSAAAVRDLHRDLEVVDQHSRRFLAACIEPDELPAGASAAEQRGYVFMHPNRRLLCYNLDEPEVDRRRGPALPYARCMLGARAVHEWAHLAVEVDWVPSPDMAKLGRCIEALGGAFDDAIAAAPAAVQAATAPDLSALTADGAAPSPGNALAWLIMRRVEDFQANLLAQRFLDPAERETYVRQNIRALRAEYAPAARWRLLARYLYEAQYLRFSDVPDPRAFLLRSTWCDADLLDNGTVRPERFDALLAAVGAVCDCYAVDERRFRRVS